MTRHRTDPIDPDAIDAAPEDDELTAEEVAAIRASQADPGTPLADDPDAG